MKLNRAIAAFLPLIAALAVFPVYYSQAGFTGARVRSPRHD